MTEREWLACTDPQKMLEFLRGKGSGRKLRLFIADGVRVLGLRFGKEQEALSEMHERVAEGQATEADLERWLLRDLPWLWEHRAPGGNLPGVWESARMLVRDRFKLAPLEKREIVTPESRDAENADMCSVLRCIFGNPFRPVTLDPAWLTPIVLALARAAYDERVRPEGTLNPARLAVLADALEDAGCTDADVLGHLRGPGPHVRGCWCLDLLLGKT